MAADPELGTLRLDVGAGECEDATLRRCRPVFESVYHIPRGWVGWIRKNICIQGFRHADDEGSLFINTPTVIACGRALVDRMRRRLLSAVGLDPGPLPLICGVLGRDPLPPPPPFFRLRRWLGSVLFRWHREKVYRQTERACLEYYNAMHPASEFELAPGDMTKYRLTVIKGGCFEWTHGNFLACRRRSGFFSFMPAPRTLFFYEVSFNKVVTCVPLEDESVDEAYSWLGFWLGWGIRNNETFDRVCRTCRHRLAPPGPFRAITTKLECGHQEFDHACDMCYINCHVIHPSPEKFEFGHCQNHQKKGDNSSRSVVIMSCFSQ